MAGQALRRWFPVHRMTLTSPAPHSDPALPQQKTPWLAVAAILLAVAVWGLQFVMIRLGVTTDLTGNDLATLRFAVAGPFLLPLFFRYGWRDCAGLGWRDGLVLTCLGGLPMGILSNWGLTFAPANHAACIQPGTVGIIATVAGALMAGTGLPAMKLAGLALALAGLGGVAFGAPAAVAGPDAWFGDIIFVVAGVCWAAYTIILARKKASPLASTVTVGVLSMAMVPILLAFFPTKLATASWSSILLHGLFQGVLNYLLAFGLWSYSARVLGPVKMGLFAPLIPVFGVFSAMPILGEYPTALQWLGIAGVLFG
ncbi:MAG: DMT family transporter, partial [Beijerinckiaceae bacterium]